MSNDRVLILGRAGQLGTELSRVYRDRGYEVVAFGRADVDVTDGPRVEELVMKYTPALVLNATAYNMVDVAERDVEGAFRGNALAVRNMAVACRQTETKLVHFSTDYVFDGTKGSPYVEQDATHPLGAYGVSKLAGESFALAYLDDPLIIRTCGVFGLAGLNTGRGNFIETMLRLAKRPDPIRVVEDFVASPTGAADLAARTADLTVRKAWGVFHVGGGTVLSWYDFARLIFEEAGVQPEVRPTSHREYRTPARRPQFSALSNGKMERLGIAPMPPLRDAVRAYMAGRSVVS